MEEIINKNRDLLDMRKKIILTISHDIRAPLSIINGSAELAMDTRDRKKRNGHLANIGVLCKHILHLLNNLLDVYRLNEAKETRHDIPFRLSGLLERIAAGFTHTANDKGLQCKKNILLNINILISDTVPVFFSGLGFVLLFHITHCVKGKKQ